MDELIDFLDQVLPATGWVCVVGISKTGGGVRTQKFFSTHGEAIEEAQALADEGLNVYFGCATFKTNESREQGNAQHLQSFFLDLDCKDKGFADKGAALAALKVFCKTTGLPRPTIVDSGGGLHVYWPLTAPVSAEKWKPLASALKRLCAEKKFAADPAVTADSARILRVPTTFNHKFTPAAEVRVLHMTQPVELAVIEQALQEHVVLFDPSTVAPSAKKDGATEWVQDPNIRTRFDRILSRPDPCMQLQNVVDTRADAQEPLWRAALSIAWRCEDRDEALKRVSEGHPGYSEQSTRSKASGTKGPYTCEQFDNQVLGICDACPHRGNIKSPISLGAVLAETVGVPHEEIAKVWDSTDVHPALPYPYHRGEKGGIYRDLGGGPTKIYENDFYVIDRIDDDIQGETVAFRLHLPNDAIRQFTLPLMVVTSKDKLREELCRYGMVVYGKQMDYIMEYVSTWVKDLQTKRSAAKSVYQFGWTPEFKGFVVGATEYGMTEEQDKYSPPSEPTAQFKEHMTPKGTLEGWKRVAAFYNHPSMIKYQFGVCAGFGSILYAMSGTDGGLLISVESPQSGHGKSYMAYVVNSIYGHPRATVLGAKSTDNAIMSRLGVWNSLPVHIDEVTKWPAERMADFVYAFNNGIGKARMQASVNAERVNRATWRNISFMTSNSMVYTTLAHTKAVPLGEMMRVFPLRISEALSVDQMKADATFAYLDKNYGVAGVHWARYVLKNKDKLKQDIEDMKLALINSVGFRHPHRFWLAGVACALVAANHAERAGILMYNPRAVAVWATQYCTDLIREVSIMERSLDDGLLVLGDMLSECFNSMVVASKATEKNTLTAIVTPKSNFLNARLDIDTREIFIRMSYFTEYCQKKGLEPSLIRLNMERQGAVVEATTCRLAAGTTLDTSAPVRVLRIQGSEAFNEQVFANITAPSDDSAAPDETVQAA